MKIERKEVYMYRGEAYPSIAKVKEVVENHLGAIIDSCGCSLAPKQRLKILEGLVKNRHLLHSLLDVTVDIPEPGPQSPCSLTKNVLDVKA